ncbi:MAG: DEAD/DEAH box helicase [Saprospiraceae bacterium]|nr:DEAD/DEAH box helicase [Saprospiraceae bacterium]
MQFKCIPNILKGEDLLAIAQTGTGKTAAFAIPILHILHSKVNTRRRMASNVSLWFQLVSWQYR